MPIAPRVFLAGAAAAAVAAVVSVAVASRWEVRRASGVVIFTAANRTAAVQLIKGFEANIAGFCLSTPLLWLAVCAGGAAAALRRRSLRCGRVVRALYAVPMVSSLVFLLPVMGVGDLVGHAAFALLVAAVVLRMVERPGLVSLLLAAASLMVVVVAAVPPAEFVSLWQQVAVGHTAITGLLAVAVPLLAPPLACTPGGHCRHGRELACAAVLCADQWAVALGTVYGSRSAAAVYVLLASTGARMVAFGVLLYVAYRTTRPYRPLDQQPAARSRPRPRPAPIADRAAYRDESDNDDDSDVVIASTGTAAWRRTAAAAPAGPDPIPSPSPSPAPPPSLPAAPSPPPAAADSPTHPSEEGDVPLDV